MGVGGQRQVPAGLALQGKNPSTRCTGGRADPGTSLDACEEGKISCNQWSSNPETTSL